MADQTKVSRKLSGKRHGIQSVDVAIDVLHALAREGGPAPLGRLSRACGLSKSKTHRYLHSLSAGGLAKQDKHSGDYALGPLVVHLAMAGLQQTNVVSRAFDDLARLVDELECHVGIAIWNAYGPMIVKWQQCRNADFVAYSAGQSLPIMSTAIGRVFAAFLPTAMSDALIRKELTAQFGDSERELASVGETLRETREKGYSVARGSIFTLSTAVAVPLFDHENELVAVVAALLKRSASEKDEGRALAALLKFSSEV
jgi:DNA-binding IclR family transcriptional regulator